MTERLLKNKPLDRNRILSELCEPFPDTAVKRTEDKKAYIPAEYFRDRLNKVVGLYNYKDEYEDLDILNVKDSCVIKVKCTLYLLDDDGKPFLQKSAYGGATVIFPNIVDSSDPEHKRKNKATTSNTVPNTIASAEQDAFKRVCKRIGMAEANLASERTETAEQNQPAEEELLKVTFTAFYNEYRGNIYSVVELDNQSYQFVCFGKDGALAGYDEQSLDALLKKGNTISGYFIRNLYQGRIQLVLKRMADS